MTGILLACLVVLLTAVIGYSTWVLGVNQRDALEQRTALDTVEAGPGAGSTGWTSGCVAVAPAVGCTDGWSGPAWSGGWSMSGSV